MADLTTLANMKTVLEIPTGDTSRDAVLTLLITEVSALVEDYCDRIFGSVTYTEFYSGDNTSILVVGKRPITAILNLWADDSGEWGQGTDAFSSSTLLVAGQDYALQIDQPDGSSRCGLVHRLNGVWSRPFVVNAGNLSAWSPVGKGNIKIQYTAGFATIPGAVALAAQMSVSRIWRMMKFGGLVQSETTPKYAYSLATNLLRADGNMCLPPEVMGMLGRYREIAIA